jgi:hypothetical protein
MDRGQTHIATSGAVVAFSLEVIKKRAEEGRIQIRHGQLRGRLTKPLQRVLYQQTKGIAVARDGVGARLPLSHESIDEE